MNIEDFKNKVIQGDCLEVMKDIPDGSVDMILCDLPYGTTACKWDTIIPFEPLWEQYKRIIKDNGAIVLFSSQPFTTDLINSNRNNFRYQWIWDKKNKTGIYMCKKRPLKQFEDILVFYSKQPVYNPQMIEGKFRNKKITSKKVFDTYGKSETIKEIDNFNNLYYPSNILEFSNAGNMRDKVHPTQKPVALFEYLIKTYTNEGDLVLDNCAGSGTTGVACQNTNRNYILIEKEPEYVDIINKRLQ